MKIWLKFPVIMGVAGWALVSAWAGAAPSPDISAALQAIQQAPDPSAAVAAYANGVAINRNDPKLEAVYVSRMVDLGLPELAFHQAQMLTTLQSNNGLAWGVVAYVDARRGQMPEAISAINLAGQFAANNPFVERTAGELVAWYDTKGDQATLPENVREGLTKIRNSLQQRPAFTEAYNKAMNAYKAQASAPQPAQSVPSQYAPEPQAQPQGDQIAPLGYGPAASSAAYYYPDNYYAWGTDWVEPAPWWWWQPVGFWGGCAFFPFGTVVVFDNDRFFHHHHDFDHDRMGGRQAFFHQHNGSGFLGAAAQPNTLVARSMTSNFHPAPTMANNSPQTMAPASWSGTAVPRAAWAASSPGGALRFQGFHSPGVAVPRFASPSMSAEHSFARGEFFGGGRFAGGFHGGGGFAGGGGGGHDGGHR